MMVVIHFVKDSVFILIGGLAVSHSLSIYSSSTKFISKKKLVPALRSFKGTIIVYIEYSQPSIISTQARRNEKKSGGWVVEGGLGVCKKMLVNWVR